MTVPPLNPEALHDRPEALFDDLAGSVEGVEDGALRLVPFLPRHDPAQVRMQGLPDPVEPGLVFLPLFGAEVGPAASVRRVPFFSSS